MTESEAQALLQHHGITASQQVIYHYKGFRYGNLVDAVNYAELVQSRDFAARGQKKATTSR